MKIYYYIILFIGSSLITYSCSNQKSSTTGWEYNNSKNGGFEANNKFQEQITGPGLLFVEGGSFTMGRVEQDVMYEWNNVPRKVTVSSFYLDETEVRNVDYLEYLYWLKRVYSMSYPEVYKKALPDTLVWRDKLGYNEPFVTQYLRHPAIKENINERKLYPWNGSSLRNGDSKNQGKIMANFKRGRGDNMGVAGNLNDNADITAPVRSYWPNDYGLYNMAGNVSEWVMDVYRAEIEQTSTTDHRNFRGSVYTTDSLDADGMKVIDNLGRIIQMPVDEQGNVYRRNYKKSDNINYLDGDIESQMGTTNWNDFLNETDSLDLKQVKIDKYNLKADKYKDNAKTGNSNEMYAYGETSLVTDRTRVFKGGSWKDRAYWLSPGTRRFLDQDQSTDAIGFRCAMDRVGSPSSELKENRRPNSDLNQKKNK